MVTGEESGQLEDYFGEREYEELRQLSREAASRSTRGGPRVLILPGIMGSKLGFDDDEIWLDLIDVAGGRLSALAVGRTGGKRIRPIGVILLTYLKLKLRLQIGGFNASFWPYDWRLSVVEAGKALATAIEAEPVQVNLVAHSMGGLVARAVLPHKPRNLGRIITLGTPNYGSFSPLQAFRGSHSVVRKLTWLDHGQNDLTSIFGGFQGLSEMFPDPATIGTDLFDLSNWPDQGPRPAQELLSKARKVQKSLPTATDAPNGIIQIIGVNQETAVGAKIQDKEFIYTLSGDGDGTVPRVCAKLPDATAIYYVEEEHGSLPNNSSVARAVQSLIATGETKELPTTYSTERSGVRTVRERDLLEHPFLGDGSRRLSTREERFLIEEFASPVSHDRSSIEGVDLAPTLSTNVKNGFSDRIVISRQTQRHLEINLTFGSLTDVAADAYVLGIFKNVGLGGAAVAVDNLLDGGVSQALSRRMFNSNVGEISILPKGRHAIRADFVAFAGLGPIDSFREGTLETVGENLIRTFVNAHVSDFATVLIGGASGILARSGLESLLTGFARGLVDADKDRFFSRVTICEIDPTRYEQLKRDMYELCGGSLFDGIEVTLQTRTLPVTAPPARATMKVGGPEAEPIYLLVRQFEDENDERGFQASVLTKGAKAAIHRAWKPLNEQALEAHLRQVVNGAPPAGQMEPFGTKLASLVLPDTIATVLDQFKNDHVVVVHDAGASRIPWEALYVKGRSLALSGGLSHRYEADDLSVAKWLEERLSAPTLRVLLIVNPTGDLPGATREGDRVDRLLNDTGNVQVRRLDGDEARRAELLRCFQSGEFDAVHYAGHAFFDRDAPSRSGILCAGGEVLSGADLAGIGNLPSLVFFNACEVGRIRRRNDPNEVATPAPDLLRRNVGFAEAFLRGGIANFVGTYWPVDDAAAGAFAPSFYEGLLAGQTLAEALMNSRSVLQQAKLGDWADYILYGDPTFVVKRGRQQ
ncbi:CHAT domain-containing protein (plasmid) [Rhizobium leguminosarum]